MERSVAIKQFLHFLSVIHSMQLIFVRYVHLFIYSFIPFLPFQLGNGQLVKVAAYLVKRLKQHFHSLKQYGVDMIIGCNGYIWIAVSSDEKTLDVQNPSSNKTFQSFLNRSDCGYAIRFQFSSQVYSNRIVADCYFEEVDYYFEKTCLKPLW